LIFPMTVLLFGSLCVSKTAATEVEGLGEWHSELYQGDCGFECEKLPGVGNSKTPLSFQNLGSSAVKKIHTSTLSVGMIWFMLDL